MWCFDFVRDIGDGGELGLARKIEERERLNLIMVYIAGNYSSWFIGDRELSWYQVDLRPGGTVAEGCVHTAE